MLRAVKTAELMNSNRLASALDIGLDAGAQQTTPTAKRESTTEERGGGETGSLGSLNSLNSPDTNAFAAGSGATRTGARRMTSREVDEGTWRRRKSDESYSMSLCPLTLSQLPSPPVDTLSEAESERLSVQSAQLLYMDPDLDIEPELPSPERLIPEAIWKKYDKREKERQKILHGMHTSVVEK